MDTYTFDLHFAAAAGDDIVDALFEAGWDDAAVSFDTAVGGEGIATFDRGASTAVEAVSSAIAQGRQAGADIIGVTENLVPLSEIAERTDRSFATVDHWAHGRRGPGEFPTPRVKRARASLYSWAAVAQWLHQHGLAEISNSDVEMARVCEIADSLVQAHRLQHELDPGDRQRLCRAVA